MDLHRRAIRIVRARLGFVSIWATIKSTRTTLGGAKTCMEGLLDD